ncbi:hypothetical protein F7734_51865 [Scytonema sp. UIC 10036]|uniref:hypothetical protein n=1 Tax=Scytonema sp. UIC 10036 TaxID=2304196 RepID=UPI0012DAF027|nr:hypothetical protein [Scytonema sp. UIC 10036]MUH00323.1 hypothetical protein [Scytonema sp. UIC 10036]
MKLIAFKISDELALKLGELIGDDKSISLVARDILEQTIMGESRPQPVTCSELQT